jgi:hypothetical protein
MGAADMEKEFSVTLTDRTEVVEYREANNVYRFDLGKKGREWIVYLPPSRDLPAADAEKILARITAYLGKRWWFWLFPRTYTVRIEHK